MLKKANLSFSVSAQSYTNNVDSIKFSTQDKNSAKLVFTIKEGKEPLNLTDIEGKVDLIMGDKSPFDDGVAIVTDPLKGMLEYTITPEQIRHPGRARGELQLVHKDGSSVGGFRFTFTVNKALLDEYAGPIKEFYINDLEAVKEEARKKVDEIQAISDSIADVDVVRIDTRLGELEEQIGEGVGVDEQARQGIEGLTERLADTAKKTELEVERQRISQLQTIPEGGTTADAALNDIKVAADGLVYNTPGEAVRNQVGRLSSALDTIVTYKDVSENLIQSSEIQSGKQVSGSNGNMSDNTNYAVTGFIPVKKGWKLSGYVAPNTATFAAVGYDKDKKFLMNITSLSDYTGDTTTRRWTATITFDGFIRCNLPIGQIATAMLKLNADYPAGTPTYVPYQIPTVKRASDILLPVNVGMVQHQDTPIFKVNNGLFDKSKSVTGYISWSNGNINASEVYKTTDFISLEKNTDYTIQSAFRYFLAYDTNKQPIADSYLQSVTNNHTFNTGNNIGFIRFSYYAHSEQYAYITKGNSPTFDIQKGTVSLETDNKLFGKKLISLGDSIMAGDGNGGWGIGDIISSKNSMYHADYSRGGATIGLRDEFVNADTEEQKRLNIQYQVDSAITGNTDTNFILVNGQTNDIDKANIIPIGAITDKFDGSYDLRTFAGGLESIFYKLKAAFPLAKIVYVCVHAQGSRTLNAQTTRVNLAKQVCQKWGVKVADIFGEGTMNTFLSQYVSYTNNGDKTHPNMEGYNRFYIPIVENSMKVIS